MQCREKPSLTGLCRHACPPSAPVQLSCARLSVSDRQCHVARQDAPPLQIPYLSNGSGFHASPCCAGPGTRSQLRGPAGTLRLWTQTPCATSGSAPKKPVRKLRVPSGMRLNSGAGDRMRTVQRKHAKNSQVLTNSHSI